jgi:hypothetical protein
LAYALEETGRDRKWTYRSNRQPVFSKISMDRNIHAIIPVTRRRVPLTPSLSPGGGEGKGEGEYYEALEGVEMT